MPGPSGPSGRSSLLRGRSSGPVRCGTPDRVGARLLKTGCVTVSCAAGDGGAGSTGSANAGGAVIINAARPSTQHPADPWRLIREIPTADHAVVWMSILAILTFPLPASCSAAHGRQRPDAACCSPGPDCVVDLATSPSPCSISAGTATASATVARLTKAA